VTPTFTNIPTRTPVTETAAESDDSGGILDTVLGLLGTIAPFALAAVVVGGLGYFLFQRIRGDESAS
jgi:hypothetical protein